MEIHTEDQIEKENEFIDIIGVNNRDLKTFKVDNENSIRISSKIPSQFVKISESGISSPEDVKKLKKYGFQGFLIGENFMKSDQPGKACSNFIKAIR